MNMHSNCVEVKRMRYFSLDDLVESGEIKDYHIEHENSLTITLPSGIKIAAWAKTMGSTGCLSYDFWEE